MSWKIILTSTVSAVAFCALGSVEWKMVNRYEQQSTNSALYEAYMSAGWRGGASARDIWIDREVHSETGRIRSVKQFLPHSGSMEFFLSHLARQYSNDVCTLQGRIKWHGKPVHQELDDTNRMCMVEYYADGTVHVDPYRKKGNFHSLTNTALWRNASEAKRQKVLEMREKAKALRAKIEAKKSVLPGLKAAQLQTFDNKNTESNVTVNVNIGGSRDGR